VAQRPEIVTAPLSTRMGLGQHELIAIVGAGGKTTILHTLGRELASSGNRVVLTTTTRMAPDQITDPVCWSNDTTEVEAALAAGTPLFVLSHRDSDKVVGLEPETVDGLFTSTSVDHLIVEADGARTMSIKAPADHEPVMPSAATTVVVVMGADALGRRFGVVAHRVERITALTGLTQDDVVTPQHAASILLHPDGGLKSIPDTARVVTAITKVSPENASAIAELRAILDDNARVDRCVEFSRPPG